MLTQRDRSQASKRATGRHVVAAAMGIVLTAFIHAVPVQAQQNNVPSAERNDALTAARFAIVIDGVQIGVFAQLISEAGLGTGAAGQAITLTGGRTQGLEMAAWHELVILGDVAAARKNASIIVYNSSRTPVKRYVLTNAWPSKVHLVTGERGQLRTATVMLVYEGLQVLGE